MEKEEILARAKKYIAEEKDERFRKEVEELVAKEDMKELEDRFYQTLEFGTGGLRGIMGGGTNRMNTLEINLATQGLANYVLKAFPQKAKAPRGERRGRGALLRDRAGGTVRECGRSGA